MIKDYLNFAIRSLTQRKLRSWLTILGIVIGIAAVVSLIAIGQGMEAAVTEQFEQMGTNKVFVMPGGEPQGMGPQLDVVAGLTKDDLDTVKGVGGVDIAAGMLMKTAAIEYKGEKKFTSVSGMPVDDTMRMIQEASSFEIAEGRELKDTDRYKVEIGDMLAHDLFDKEIKVRSTIKINGKDFKVVGILKKIGNKEDDTSAIITIDVAREIFEAPDEVSMIFAEIKSGTKPADAAEDIERALRRHRNEKEGEESFFVMTAEDLLDTFGQILGVIQLVLVGIAAISLLVGAVGIMNTMYMSVSERVSEIGIMKAIGATNKAILIIFLIESGLVGLVGGGIGILMGALLAKGVETAGAAAGVVLLKAYITPALVLGALAFSFILGMISGVLPARQASKLKPVDALRHE